MNLTKKFFNQKLATYSKNINTLWNRKKKTQYEKIPEGDVAPLLGP